MIIITIPGLEYYNEDTNEFTYYEDWVIELEHSLVSISKWESKWCKPFMSGKDKTLDEITDYIKCMTITDNVPSDVYSRLTNENLEVINEYIGRPMTATTFSDNGKSGASREIITSEVIYYWMIALNIPFECQYWHLNRLLTLIKVCNTKNNPPKKMSKQEIARRNRALNEARRKQFETRG